MLTTASSTAFPPTLSKETISPLEVSSVSPKSRLITVSIPEAKLTLVSYGARGLSIDSGISFTVISLGFSVSLYGVLPTCSSLIKTEAAGFVSIRIPAFFGLKSLNAKKAALATRPARTTKTIIVRYFLTQRKFNKAIPVGQT